VRITTGIWILIEINMKYKHANWKAENFFWDSHKQILFGEIIIC